MKIGKYTVYAPFLADDKPSEAEVWGASVWLWMLSPRHSKTPLRALAKLLLPLIKQKQYVLVLENSQPCFFLSWGALSAETEQRYLAGCDESELYQQLRSGNRIWLFDWIAPSDEENEMAELIMSTIFPAQCFRMLRLNESEKSIRIIEFKGHKLSEKQAAEWRAAHPVMYPQKAQQNSQAQK
ncbi:hypothetical protein UA45_19405 [Morganella morganii]|uniref:RTX toxin-activating lysine-acyltransferase n=1 Tax=Morganella morganii TaxID=582 RepID=A0A0D8L543_MORMO|nr:hypothetical protein UA45_19405 [Morganella morganii]HDF2343155.1 toxin-activating lysine-acyltransferase [Morganella morganii]